MGFRYQLLGWLKKIIIGCFQLPLSIFIVLAGFVIGIVVFKLLKLTDFLYGFSCGYQKSP